ncbi:MAG: DUF349 domain-containing protein [Acidobacteria bacterium]|nr:DUF349 domain-containing protein [Acidobacteriota bacterium]
MRASAVRALTNAEQDLLLEIARSDDAPGVRRAAIERLTDAASIAELLGGGGESDPDVRAAAVATARDLLIGAADASGADAVLAVLPEERDVAAVARLAVSEAVSERAVARLTDAKVLGGVARRAKHPEAARLALERLADRGELLTVVLKAESKTIAFAAFDRLSAEPAGLPAATLIDIARRASHKAVARRARSELAGREGDAPEAAPADPSNAVSLCEAAEALAGITDLDAGRREIEALVQRWATLDAPGDAAVAARFAAARRAAEDRLLELDRATSNAREAEARRVAALAPYAALCERVERSGGPLALDQLQAAREEWSALAPPAAGDGDDGLAAEVEDLARRFAAAATACERRHREWASRREHLQHLEGLTAELETLASGGDAAAIQARWPALDERWRAEVARLGSGGAAGDAEVAEGVAAVTGRRAAAEETKRAVETRAHAEDHRRLRDRLARLDRLAARVEAEAANEKLVLADAERHLRRTRQALEEARPLLADADRAALGRRLRNAQTALLGRVRELRDFADWQRWANLGVQEELCREMEALGATVAAPPDGGEGAVETDEAELARKFRDLIDRWRQAADVPKDRGEDLWRRFKAAHDVVYPRCEAYFETQRTARSRNLDALEALADEAERLSESTDWIKTAQRLTTLQAEWKALGPVPRREQRALWKRFHGACSLFFTRRKADLAERKKVWAKNLEQKEALCVRVEALADATDVAAAVEEVQRTQREWRTIGAVRRSKSDLLWQRFREACEAVIDRSHEGERAAAGARIAAREALCAELEALLPSGAGPAAAPPDDAETGVEAVGGATDSAAPPAVAPEPAADTAGGETDASEPAVAVAPAIGAPEAAPADAGTTAEAEQPVADTDAAPAASGEPAPDRSAEPSAAAAPEFGEPVPDVARGATAEPPTEEPASAPTTASAPAAASAPVAASAPAAAPAPAAASEPEPATASEPARKPLEPAALLEAVREIQARWRQAPEVPADDRRRLSARFGRAVARLVEARPEAFRDTDLDPARQLKQLERLCQRAEALVSDAPETAAKASPAELLARRWREQLANNTMGVRVDEGARRRAAVEEIKRLQVERRRLGQIPGDAAREFGARFQRACDRALQRSRSATT